jgi:hypothetical protein
MGLRPTREHIGEMPKQLAGDALVVGLGVLAEVVGLAVHFGNVRRPGRGSREVRSGSRAAAAGEGARRGRPSPAAASCVTGAGT